MRNTVSLLTVFTSIAPVKGTVMRGCTLKPSSVLRTSMSAQSDGRALQSGFGRGPRRNVFLEKSGRVKRSLGDGPLSVLDPSPFTATPAPKATLDAIPRLDA